MRRLLETVKTVRTHGGTDRAYECGFCSKRFEDDRLNCPACGFSAVREAE